MRPLLTLRIWAIAHGWPRWYAWRESDAFVRWRALGGPMPLVARLCDELDIPEEELAEAVRAHIAMTEPEDDRG